MDSKNCPLLRVESARLILIAANRELIAAELDPDSAVADRLLCEPPHDWPPEHLDAAAFLYIDEQLKRHPDDIGWWYWYVIDRETNRLVGTTGLKGRPSESGDIEVGYSTLSTEQGRGIATEATALVIDWAQRQAPGIRTVLAHTLKPLIASQRVLDKLGFRCVGLVEEPDVLRYEKAL